MFSDPHACLLGAIAGRCLSAAELDLPELDLSAPSQELASSTNPLGGKVKPAEHKRANHTRERRGLGWEQVGSNGRTVGSHRALEDFVLSFGVKVGSDASNSRLCQRTVGGAAARTQDGASALLPGVPPHTLVAHTVAG